MNKLNVSPEDFNMDSLSEIVTAVRNNHKALVTMDDTVAEAQKRDNELKSEMQTALDANDLDKIQKIAAERKRLAKKLSDSPEEKLKQFDEAVDKLVEFAEAKPLLAAVDDDEDEAEAA